MTPSCITCSSFRPAFGGRCHRDMLMESGQIIKQHNSGRLTDIERNDKHPTWRSMKRNLDDVCGKTGKWWEAK